MDLTDLILSLLSLCPFIIAARLEIPARGMILKVFF
jgi:hypothetical protein